MVVFGQSWNYDKSVFLIYPLLVVLAILNILVYHRNELVKEQAFYGFARLGVVGGLELDVEKIHTLIVNHLHGPGHQKPLEPSLKMAR